MVNVMLLYAYKSYQKHICRYTLVWWNNNCSMVYSNMIVCLGGLGGGKSYHIGMLAKRIKV